MVAGKEQISVYYRQVKHRYIVLDIIIVDFNVVVCHDDLITPSVSYLGDMKVIMKTRNTVQIIQSKLKSKSSMQFERFDIVNGKFESRGILTRSCANSKKDASH